MSRRGALVRLGLLALSLLAALVLTVDFIEVLDHKDQTGCIPGERCTFYRSSTDVPRCRNTGAQSPSTEWLMRWPAGLRTPRT